MLLKVPVTMPLGVITLKLKRDTSIAKSLDINLQFVIKEQL